jgi:predicted nucleotidyltransferase
MLKVGRSRIPLSDEQVQEFCQRWGIVELALFGSVLREDFRPDSDLDVLVRFAEGWGTSLTRYFAMERELSDLVGRPVDIVDRRALDESANWLRRRRIFESSSILYAA